MYIRCDGVHPLQVRLAKFETMLGLFTLFVLLLLMNYLVLKNDHFFFFFFWFRNIPSRVVKLTKPNNMRGLGSPYAWLSFFLLLFYCFLVCFVWGHIPFRPKSCLLYLITLCM